MQSFHLRAVLLLSGCLALAALLNVPLAVWGVAVNWNDYSSTLLSRIAVANEFAGYGWFHRFSLMLSGVNAAENGLDPKLDTLLFAALDPVKATHAYYVVRDFGLLAGLSTLLVVHYRVTPIVALAASALACEGFNVLNWYFFGFDYFAPVFLFGYQFLPLLVLPALILGEKPKSRRLVTSFALSVAVGALYSFSTTFALAAFTVPLAALWIAVVVRSQSALWPVVGILIGASVIALPGIVGFLNHEGSIRNSLRDPSELASLWDALRYLVHRDPRLTAVGGVLLLAAGASAALGRRLPDFAPLCLLYLVAMAPDVLVKSVLAPLAALPPVLLSVNYYSYLVAPIFLCAAFAVGFGSLPKLEVAILSVALLVLAGAMAFGKMAAEHRRPGMQLSGLLAEPTLTSLARLTTDKGQRAAMLTADVASLSHFNFRIPRPVPIYLNARGIATSDGFASSMGYDYAVLWSNILRPTRAPELLAPDIFRQAYLQIDVRDYLKEGADGTKKFALPGINTDLLGLTATRFIVSYLDVDDPRLRLIRPRSPGPIVCRDMRFVGGFNVCELKTAAERVSVARNVEILEDARAVLSKMRLATAAQGRDTVYLAAPDVETGAAEVRRRRGRGCDPAGHTGPPFHAREGKVAWHSDCARQFLTVRPGLHRRQAGKPRPCQLHLHGHSDFCWRVACRDQVLRLQLLRNPAGLASPRPVPH